MDDVELDAIYTSCNVTPAQLRLQIVTI